jgi:hypothetical protein
MQQQQQPEGSSGGRDYGGDNWEEAATHDSVGAGAGAGAPFDTYYKSSGRELREQPLPPPPHEQSVADYYATESADQFAAPTEWQPALDRRDAEDRPAAGLRSYYDTEYTTSTWDPTAMTAALREVRHSAQVSKARSTRSGISERLRAMATQQEELLHRAGSRRARWTELQPQPAAEGGAAAAAVVPSSRDARPHVSQRAATFHDPSGWCEPPTASPSITVGGTRVSGRGGAGAGGKGHSVLPRTAMLAQKTLEKAATRSARRTGGT